MNNRSNTKRKNSRKAVRGDSLRQSVITLSLFACLIIPGLILPHVFLEATEKDIYGVYTIARADTPMPFGSDSDFHSDLITCLSYETGDINLYQLTAQDLMKEEILERAENILKRELMVNPKNLNSAYVYGDYYEMGLWQMEWTAYDDSTIYLSMEAESGMLLRVECQRREPLDSESILHFLDYYADWQIYYSNQPSWEENQENYIQKSWLSNQDIGLAITETRLESGMWQLSLQLFHSTT